MVKKLTCPFQPEDVLELRAGEQVLLSGTIYTARDAAHKRMYEAVQQGKSLPVNLMNQVIYYVGPTPAKEGEIIGSAGPTTSGRMDKYTPRLLEMGLKGMLGKGYRSNEVIQSISKNQAVYMAVIGGTGALLARKIKSSEVVAYEDLGTEAIRKLEIVDLPAVVINDAVGGDWYKSGVAAFQARNK